MPGSASCNDVKSIAAERTEMKKEELTALGISEETAAKVLEINGKDIEHAKSVKDKAITDITAERDGLKAQLDTAAATLKKFEGIDPEQIQTELQSYKTKAEEAEKQFARELTQRDQRDWLKAKLDEYGVSSPYARKQLEAECMSADTGLKWKDGAFFGFDDYMKVAKEKDAGLYLTDEEKKAAENAPVFTGPTGDPGVGGKKYTPPKIF